MAHFVRTSLLALATAATLLAAGAAAPAAAHDRWDGGRGWHDRDRDRPRYDHDWGRRYDRPYHRSWYGWGYRAWVPERCWTDVRRVRVYTPWGPRIRLVERRVCG